jgi:hypothetical protein
MEKTRPPVRILSPCRVYRRDSDISHTPCFIRSRVSLWTGGHLRRLEGVLTAFLKQVLVTRRCSVPPSFFPFTNPVRRSISSASSAAAGVAGLRPERLVEILGSGMVDPRSSRTSVTIRKSSPALPSVSVWNGLPCSNSHHGHPALNRKRPEVPGTGLMGPEPGRERRLGLSGLLRKPSHKSERSLC